MRGMDATTVQKLIRLNEVFYRENSASFSYTRQHAWAGWERVMGSLAYRPSSVLDVACGNARFKGFLDGFPATGRLQYHGLDSCPDLLPEDGEIDFQHLDIIGAMLDGSLTMSIEAPACDLVACFGFMHHVPTEKLRMELMATLVEKTAQGGTLAVSFWQFADDPKMLEKARVTTLQGCAELDLALDGGDYLLGWEGKTGSYRYCHSFSEVELDAIVAHCRNRAHLVDRFKADGKTGQMNGYLVFRKS